jgi:hypothetical protein
MRVGAGRGRGAFRVNRFAMMGHGKKLSKALTRAREGE